MYMTVCKEEERERERVGGCEREKARERYDSETKTYVANAYYLLFYF